jgi:ABC-type Zn uptake system ZnuABC Zn-binding protein ZnuA
MPSPTRLDRPRRHASSSLFANLTATLALASLSLVAGAAAQERLSIVATTSILADLTRNVAGDRASVTSLLGAGADVHTYDPSPGDLARVARADVLVINGAGLEAFLDRLIASAGGRFRTIVASAGLTPLPFDHEHGEHGHHDEEDDHADEHGHEDEHGRDDHHHTTGDPHFWQDVRHAMHYVANIRDGLIAADPAGEGVYRHNAERYLAELADLDRWVVDQVASIPPERRRLVTNHEAFNYFAARYGLQMIGAVFPGFGTERDPSPAEIAELVRRIREFRVPAVFAENVVNTRLADQVAREAGVRVVATLHSDALGTPGSGAETYIAMMRTNVAAIVAALR